MGPRRQPNLGITVPHVIWGSLCGEPNSFVSVKKLVVKLIPDSTASIAQKGLSEWTSAGHNDIENGNEYTFSAVLTVGSSSTSNMLEDLLRKMAPPMETLRIYAIAIASTRHA